MEELKAMFTAKAGPQQHTKCLGAMTSGISNFYAALKFP